nr:MAG TPA: hypothetical protein [Caudoviricetes sp.]
MPFHNISKKIFPEKSIHYSFFVFLLKITSFFVLTTIQILCSIHV